VLPNLVVTLTTDLLLQLIPLDVPKTTESYYAYSQRNIVADIKDTVCRVPDSAFDGDLSPFCLFLFNIANMLIF